jgi:hypothetical protein
MTTLLLTFSLLSLGSCAKEAVHVVSSPATVQCQPSEAERCYSVSQAFILEHKALMIENIRLKARECK